MDFTVRESHRLPPLAMQISQTHCDHSRLFFLNVHEFDKTLLAASLKVPLASLSVCIIISCTTGASILLSLVKHHLDVPFSDLQFVLFHDV